MIYRVNQHIKRYEVRGIGYNHTYKRQILKMSVAKVSHKTPRLFPEPMEEETPIKGEVKRCSTLPGTNFRPRSKYEKAVAKPMPTPATESFKLDGIWPLVGLVREHQAIWEGVESHTRELVLHGHSR